jgi:nucleotide-binding universal stress UspA family protein
MRHLYRRNCRIGGPERNEEAFVYHQIVVGTDGSSTATRAVESAARLAAAHDAQLLVIVAYPSGPDRRLEAERRACAEHDRWRFTPGAVAESTMLAGVQAARAAGGPGLRVEGRADIGAPVDVLLGAAAACDADVLVVGNRVTWWQRLTGNGIGAVLSRRASCDVLVVDTVARKVPDRAARRVVTGVISA